jgi:Leucine-rich repeat (LRR) protein
MEMSLPPETEGSGGAVPLRSPSAEERKLAIKKKHDEEMTRRRFADKAEQQRRQNLERQQAMELRRQHELEAARDGKLTAEERNAMVQAKRDARDKEIHDALAEKLAIEHAEQKAKWGTILDIGEKLSEINASWYKLDTIPEVIYDSPARNEMLCLRLVGVGLVDLSERVAATFTNLRTLVVDANKLTGLPRNLFHLHGLKEVSAMRNRIARLPMQMGRIASLVHLNLANNDIRSLPKGLGGLQKLEVLGLENNKLRELPSMGDLHCRVVRLNHNALESILGLFMTEEVHSEWGMTKTLEDLQLNHNQLERVPPKIGAAKKLRRIFLGRNRLSELPPQLGRCKHLEYVWLDWNQIEAIPYTFANLKKLKVISANGNPLKKPPPEILFSEGAAGLVQWCGKFNHKTEDLHHKAVILALQKILNVAANDADLSIELSDVFTPNWSPVPPGASRADIEDPNYDDGGIPKFYGFVWEAFWDRILPLVEPQYYELVNIPGAREELSEEFFLYSRHEVEDAIMEFDDSYGPVGSRGHECMYKQCSCVNRKGQRRVCVPPNPDYRCSRTPSTLVRMKITTVAEFKKHEIRRSEIKTINAALDDSRKAALIYLETRPGKRLIKSRGKEMAKEIWADLKERRKEQKDELGEERRYQKNKLRREKRIAFLHKKAERRKASLQAEKEELEGKLKDYRGAARDELEEQIIQLEYAIDNEFMLEEDQNEIDDLEREGEQDDEEREERLIEKEVENYGNETEEAIEEEKKMKRYSRMSWSQLKEDCKNTAIQDYIQEQLDAVRDKIEGEFEVMRRVMKRWLGAKKKEMFDIWKKASEGRRNRRVANEKAKAKREKLEQEAKEAQDYLQSLEAEKWVEGFDEFTERVYFEHSETGEIAWDEKPVRGFVLRK